MNDPTPTISEKHTTLTRFLEQEYVLLHVNPAIPGLVLPEHLLRNPTVTLKLSHWFQGAMEIESEKVTANLLFNGTYFNCVIPYRCVWGMTSTSGESNMWPDALPSAALESIAAPQTASTQPRIRSNGSQKAKGHLKRVK